VGPPVQSLNIRPWPDDDQLAIATLHDHEVEPRHPGGAPFKKVGARGQCSFFKATIRLWVTPQGRRPASEAQPNSVLWMELVMDCGNRTPHRRTSESWGPSRHGIGCGRRCVGAAPTIGGYSPTPALRGTGAMSVGGGTSRLRGECRAIKRRRHQSEWVFNPFRGRAGRLSRGNSALQVWPLESYFPAAFPDVCVVRRGKNNPVRHPAGSFGRWLNPVRRTRSRPWFGL